mgnify:CR=1 FL=1
MRAAANRMDNRLDARLQALQLDDPHGTADPRLPDDAGVEYADPLLLDREELEMLNVFHRSFNLPGLRYGLFKPVAKEDYYPLEEDQIDAGQLQAGLQAHTSDLLRQANALLGGEAADAIEEEIACTPESEQSELTRWMAPPSAGTQPYSPMRRSSSSAAPIRSESRPRTGGSGQPAQRPALQAAACRGGGLRSDYPS